MKLENKCDLWACNESEKQSLEHAQIMTIYRGIYRGIQKGILKGTYIELRQNKERYIEVHTRIKRDIYRGMLKKHRQVYGEVYKRVFIVDYVEVNSIERYIEKRSIQGGVQICRYYRYIGSYIRSCIEEYRDTYTI